VTLGLVVKSFGYSFIVEIENKTFKATAKSKKTDYVVGDIVQLQMVNDTQVHILGLQTRNNLIFRSDQNKSKIIASNVTQIIIVIAVKPNFNISFLNSCLISAESQNIHPIIVINKIDLPESISFIEEIEELYVNKLNYQIIKLSALTECNELMPFLITNRNLLIGQSGVGKSTITNKIIPDANARTGAITKSETSGSHTTTNATLYHLNANTDVIDCPGLHEFGLYHLEVDTLASLFPECRDLIDKCKFRNCRHLNEPNCAIVSAVKNKEMSQQRFDFLQRLTQKLQNKQSY
jgi:ribosome biogenesis GTPase